MTRGKKPMSIKLHTNIYKHTAAYKIFTTFSTIIKMLNR